jgi:FtsZ-interacting cell division protein ZipA
MTKKGKRIVMFIGIIICIALVMGIVALNRQDKNSAIVDRPIDENMDIEKEEVNIKPIKENESIDNTENEKLDNEVESQNDRDKEPIMENEDNKNKINPISKPDKEKLPEEMEKPITEPKPEEPPKPVKEEVKDKSKPPTTKEEPKKEVKGGTGEDGVVRDLKGNPTGLKPAENVEEIKGSDLLPDGKKAGEGDKF